MKIGIVASGLGSADTYSFLLLCEEFLKYNCECTDIFNGQHH